jgi:hypothetical protein
MTRLKASNDTAAANALRRAALYVRDAAFFGAALDVARSGESTVTARTTGFLIAAIELGNKVDVDLAEVLQSSEEISCPLETLSTSLRVRAGTPLPSNAAAQLLAATSTVLRRTSDPVAVRNAARCADRVASLGS